MQLILQEVEGDRMVECPDCKWTGQSSELKKGDYMELSNITEIFCPSCDKYLGFIQHDEKTNEPQQQ